MTNQGKNILLLVADDLGRYMSCCGAKGINTPHLDKLAGQGTRFDMAFASTASCSGSRSVIYTGMHTHENGQYGLNNNTHHFTTFDEVDTAPKLFNSLGYQTGIIGKVHVGPGTAYPWEIRQESESRNVAWVADRGEAFFNEAKSSERPFFLTVGYVDPHRDRTRAGFGNKEVEDERIQKNVYRPEDVDIPEFLSDLPEVRQELASYYQAIDRLDQGIGMILAALERSGLAQDTMVLFVSDNGPPFINSKTTLYDAGVRLPLLVKRPGGAAGVVNPNMISFIDILPTLLDWTGHLELNKGSRRGRSLLPIIESGDQIDGWDCVFGSHTFHEVTNYWPTRYMRTRRYKYHRNIAWKLDFPFAADLYGSLTWEGIRNSKPPMIGARPLRSYLERPPEELYDLEADPREVQNLATDPLYADLLKEYRKATEGFQRETNDPWLYRDGVSVALIQHHIDAGLEVPDRLDFNMDEPGNQTVPSIRSNELFSPPA